MVPLWRRRLLAATLPVLGLATLAVIAVGLLLVQRARQPGLMLSEDALKASLALATPHALVVVVAPLLLVRARYHDALGPGFVAVAVLLSFWMFAGSFILTVGVGTGLGINANRSPGLVVLGLLTALGALWIGHRRADRLTPRTDRAARLFTTAAGVGGAGLCIAVPWFAARLPVQSPDLAVTGDRRAVAGLSLAIHAGLALGSAGLASATACRLMTRRHAAHHARHCHNCGYDLLGAEGSACPECDHPAGSDQTRHLAQLASKGSQATACSPTSST